MDFDPVHQIQQEDDQPQPQPDVELAAQACAACKKQKRKCDKILPSCSLCIRIGRPCDYTTDTLPPPTPETFAALQQQVSNLEQLLRSSANANGSFSPAPANGQNSSNGSLSLSDGHTPPGNSLLTPSSSPLWSAPNSFPSLYFLDSNAFMYEKYQIQAPYVRVPPGALTALGNSQDLRGMIEHYFITVHSYFPIVSKIRLYQHLANPLHEPGSDIALLFLAMKLVCSEIAEGMPPQTQLYTDVKSLYSYVESQNGFSIQMIQALLLIGLYEMGHAIYPAAYLSIGNAARVGHAMGLHATRDAPQMLARPTTWTEQEERRRVWWGVVILDRFINLGHRGKPFATNDPSLETHLPTDDECWDRGQMLVAAPLSLSASQTIRAAPFARTAQSAHLMGKTLRHIDDKDIPCEYRFQDALQLSRTMRALTDVMLSEHQPSEQQQNGNNAGDRKPALCTSLAICYSSLLTLYDAYSCTEKLMENAGEDQLVFQQESIDGLSEYSSRVFDLARRVREIIERDGTAGLSPMIVDSIYQGAANYAWYVRESSSPHCGERLAELKETLLMLDRRWRVAGEYNKIVEATEFALQGLGDGGYGQGGGAGGGGRMS